MKAKNTFKKPTVIEVFSTKIIKCIESSTTYEHLQACYNMINNSIVQLKAKGYDIGISKYAKDSVNDAKKILKKYSKN